jgi:hypothetical protein
MAGSALSQGGNLVAELAEPDRVALDEYFLSCGDEGRW